MSMVSNPATDNMVPVQLGELWVGPEIPVNIFVRLDNGKFILIAKANTRTNLRGLAIFKMRKIDTVYIPENEYRKLVGRKLAEADVIIAHPNIDPVKKAFFLKTALHTVLTELEQVGCTRESLGHAQIISAHTVEVVHSQPHLAELIESIRSSTDWVLNHAIATSLFSVMLAKEMGWQQTQTLEKLALGSILQDIGLKELPMHIRMKPRNQLSMEERQLYESHPYRGVRLLQSVGSVPDDVLSIVSEHHENAQGLGFPRRLRDLRMNPLAKIVALASQFSEMTLVNPENPVPRKPQDAIYYIEKTLAQPFNRDAFQAMKSLVQNGRPKVAGIKKVG